MSDKELGYSDRRRYVTQEDPAEPAESRGWCPATLHLTEDLYFDSEAAAGSDPSKLDRVSPEGSRRENGSSCGRDPVWTWPQIHERASTASAEEWRLVRAWIHNSLRQLNNLTDLEVPVAYGLLQSGLR
jgi:hypothetical protein